MIDKRTLNGIFALISVLVLLIPIGVSGYVQERTVNNIIAVQGSYGIGETMGLYDDFANANLTDLTENWGPASSFDQPIGWDANNDTVFQGYKSGGTYTLRDGTYYGNYNVYTGAGNHTTTVDWTDVPVATYNSNRYLYIPTNYTNADLAEFDFTRIHSSISQVGTVNYNLFYEDSGGNLQTIQTIDIDANTKMSVIGYSTKQQLELYPTGVIVLGIYSFGTNFNETQASFTWMVESNSLEPEDHVFGSEFTDFSIWIALVIGMDAIFLFVLVFANPVIDFKWDDRKSWRK